MRAFLAGLLLVAFGMNATAALEARDTNGDGIVDAYFDPGSDLTWESEPGAGLVGGAGWRLPNVGPVPQSCFDVWETGPFPPCSWVPGTAVSELSYLYSVTLGNIGDQLHPNRGPFDFSILDAQPAYGVLFTSTPDPVVLGLTINIYGNFSDRVDATGETFPRTTWLVHDDDVGVAPVPEPETYALMLAALGALGLVTRRRRAI